MAVDTPSKGRLKQGESNGRRGDGSLGEGQ